MMLDSESTLAISAVKLLRKLSFVMLLKTLLSVVVFVFIVKQNVQAAGPERLYLTTQEWPPYQTYASDTIAGLSVNRLKCVLRQLEQPYQLTMTSWKNAQLLVQDGQQHGFFVAEQSKARDKYAIFSEPLIFHQWRWYFSDNLNNIDLTSEQTNQWQVSAEFGSNKWFYLHEQGFNVEKKPRNINALLDMLIHNEVDAILVDGIAMQIALKEQGMLSNSFRSQTMATKALGLYFHRNFIKKYPMFLSKFNQTITSCIEN
ncbi:MAG: transporter substrate-binding domain-containing protein [Colwellia sp.]